MVSRLFIGIILVFCSMQIHAKELRLDTLKYNSDSDYITNHTQEALNYYDSLLVSDTIRAHEVCWVLFNKGVVLSELIDPDLALECFSELLEENADGYIDNKEIYKEIGYAHENRYDFFEAEKYFHMALNETFTYDTINLGMLYNSIGRVNYLAGVYEKAVINLIKSNSFSRKVSDTSTFLSSSVNLGTVYSQWGQNEKAIKVYNDALIYIKSANYEDYKSMLLSNLGVSYFFLGEYHLALSFYEKALKIELIQGGEMDISGSYHNIGNVYEVLGRYNEALNFYLIALNIQNSVDDHEGLVLTSHDIGIVYSRLGDMDLAFSNVNKSLQIALNKGFVREEMQAYKTLSDLYAAVDSFNAAYNCQVHYNQLKDSLFSIDKNREIAKQQAKFDSEHQKTEIELLSKEKEIINSKIDQHKIVIRSFVILTLLMLVLLIFGYRLLKVRRKANEKLRAQEKKIVEITEKVLKQNDSLIDNLQYGKVIQKAVLAGKTDLGKWFSDMYFVNQAQLIVSGDFFWSKNIDNKLYVVMADCTGHGVPGGFMSMLGVAFLNDLTTSEFNFYPDELLNQLRDRVKYALNQSDFATKTHDGMDLACCLFDFDDNKLHFSGAHMPLWHHNGEELMKYKGDLMPIGVCVKEKPFTKIELDLRKGDKFYLFTDGVIDQFDNEGRRYASNKLARLLIQTNDLSFDEQKQVLQNDIMRWKGAAPQTDDSLFLGLKV